MNIELESDRPGEEAKFLSPPSGGSDEVATISDTSGGDTNADISAGGEPEVEYIPQSGLPPQGWLQSSSHIWGDNGNPSVHRWGD